MKDNCDYCNDEFEKGDFVTEDDRFSGKRFHRVHSGLLGCRNRPKGCYQEFLSHQATDTLPIRVGGQTGISISGNSRVISMPLEEAGETGIYNGEGDCYPITIHGTMDVTDYQKHAGAFRCPETSAIWLNLRDDRKGHKAGDESLLRLDDLNA